jgi:hypothetical protein
MKHLLQVTKPKFRVARAEDTLVKQAQLEVATQSFDLFERVLNLVKGAGEGEE